MNPTPDAKNVAQILPDRSSKQMSGSRFETPKTRTLKEHEPQEPTEDPGRPNATRPDEAPSDSAEPRNLPDPPALTTHGVAHTGFLHNCVTVSA
jgi:hypothetical protein